MELALLKEVLVILVLLYPVESQILELATSDLINECRNYRNIHNRINIFPFSENFDMNFLLHNLWSQKNLSVKILNKEDMWQERKILFSVKVFDTEENYLKTMEKFSAESHFVHGFFVVVFPGEVQINKTLVFEKMWLKSFYNVAILTQIGDTVDLSTFYPFHENYCNKTPSTLINRYVNNSWTRPDFFPKKFANFFKCPIKIASSEIASKFIEVIHKNGTREYVGTDVEIINALADALNFQPSINYTSKSKRNNFGAIYANGTSFGVIGQVVSGTSDLVVGLIMDSSRIKFMDVSVSYYFYPVSVMIPSGAPYTSLENLIRPFSIVVWIFFLILVTLPYMFIKVKSSTIRNVTGETNNFNYYLIMMESIVGNSIKRLPKRNFPRILIMAFIMYCLVMRTIYQSKMFYFFQSQENKKMVRNLDDMMERDMNLYVTATFDDLLPEFTNYPKE